MPEVSKKEPRISPKEFADITDAIFRKGNHFTGVSIAAHMGQKQYQLWTAVNTRGLTASEARMFSDALDQWALEMINMARKMRRLATELEGGTLPPMLPLAEARRAARPHVYATPTSEVSMGSPAEEYELPAEDSTPERAGTESEPEATEHGESTPTTVEITTFRRDIEEPPKTARFA